MVPAFRLVYNMSALAATATSMLTIVPTSVAGMITHIRNKTCVLKVGIAAGVGGACSSWFGVMLASWSPSWCVMAAAAVVIVYSATTMLKKALALPSEKSRRKVAATVTGAGAGAAEAGAVTDAASVAADQSTRVAGSGAAIGTASAVHENVSNSSDGALDDAHVTKKQLVTSALIGLAAGVISGYVGVGGGFIMVPLFLSKLSLPMKKASGTSLVAVGILVLPALATQIFLGNVNWAAGLACIVGSVPGATLGAKLQARLPERTLRFCFAGILGVAAILLVIKEMGFFG